MSSAESQSKRLTAAFATNGSTAYAPPKVTSAASVKNPASSATRPPARQQANRHEPDDQRLREPPPESGLGSRRFGSVVLVSRRLREETRPDASCKVAGAARATTARNDSHDDGAERYCCDCEGRRRRYHASANTENRRGHEGDHCRPNSNDLHSRHFAVLDVDGAHSAEEHEGRQDEQATGRSPADAVHRVPDALRAAVPGRAASCRSSARGGSGAPRSNAASRRARRA